MEKVIEINYTANTKEGADGRPGVILAPEGTPKKEIKALVKEQAELFFPNHTDVEIESVVTRNKYLS